MIKFRPILGKWLEFMVDEAYHMNLCTYVSTYISFKP